MHKARLHHILPLPILFIRHLTPVEERRKQVSVAGNHPNGAATSMGAAARWVQEHGLPPLARGVRNNGEQAMLAMPDIACGAYIGFVGPE